MTDQEKIAEEMLSMTERIKYLLDLKREDKINSSDSLEIKDLVSRLTELSKVSDETYIIFQKSINNLLEIFGLYVLSDIRFTSRLRNYKSDADDILQKESVLKAVRIESGVGYDYLPLRFRNDPEVLYTLLEHQNVPFSKSAAEWFVQYAGNDLIMRMVEADKINPVNALKILIK